MLKFPEVIFTNKLKISETSSTTKKIKLSSVYNISDNHSSTQNFFAQNISWDKSLPIATVMNQSKFEQVRLFLQVLLVHISNPVARDYLLFKTC